MARFTLYINFLEKVTERPLPAENNRVICLDLSDIAEECRIKLKVFDNKWTIHSDSGNSMSVAGNEFTDHMLADGDIIKVHNARYNFVIMVYEITGNITNFVKYSIKDRNIIKIGKDSDSDIAVDSRYISTSHGVFENNGGIWVYKDISRNGSYINGERAERETQLEMFDIISMVGFKIVFLGDCIAINREDIAVCRLSAGNGVYSAARRSTDEHMFLRSPRTVEPLFDDVLEIEPPPAPNRQRNQPLIFIIGPSVTMPLPILMSTYINSQMNGGSGARSYIGMIASVGMSALVAGGWAVAHYVYNNKTLKEDEEFRISAYKEYILKNQQLIKDKQNYDNSVLTGQFLSTADMVNRLSRDTGFLWNRNINHDDFLSIRLGTGNVDFSSHLSVPKQRFSLFKDDMSELPHKLFEKYKFIRDAVVTLPLKNMGILGMLGENGFVNRTAASILVQTAALHCYTDVRIAAFFKEKENREFDWIRWLPHVNSEDMKLRLVAEERISYGNVLYHIDEILRRRVEKLGEDSRESAFYPHYIVFCSDRDIFDGDGIEKYMPIAGKIGFTFILAYKRIDKLPNECSSIVQCDEDFSGYYTLSSKRGESDRVRMDGISADDAENFAKQISRFRVREYAAGEIPNSIEYFDMLGIGKPEQWNLIERYKENRVYEGIRSFVGIGVGGKPVYIDIHEKKYGPHGLVAGTTGSGKSETLQTFIISLALNYHPDEVAFILVDYKGGGMAFAFEGMPHIAGMITNLGSGGNDEGEIDGNVTRRALVSIRSEIKYRQSVFNRYKVNHIDAYIRLYREGTADEPLPHLIIISDEFAELKKEQPEFIKELVSTARVGRSLGIHLILATQKPGGVVDDEIWSNARFKLCLRVQDKQDSIGMLKRPEAAYLTQTGRAYLQIGNDEIFEQFQTGYSGADYIPREEAGTSSESELYMMNIDGTAAVTREHRQSKDSKTVKQLKAAVDYITDICRDNGINKARALWMPVLSDEIFLDDVMNGYPLPSDGVTAVLGIIDDPEKQKQYPAAVNLAECSNLIIAGLSGIGKTTTLQTMITSVIKNYSCDKVIFYILDFSSRILKMFGGARHCGLVAFSDDKEAVTRLFKFLFGELERRKELFNKQNVGSYTEYVRNNTLPLCLVFIDNYFSFNELYPELAEDFAKLSRDCAKYGIQLIITLNSLNDIRYKVKQNFVNTLTLIMSEKSDYREAWGITAEFMPQNS
ncbi:MAG: type VII secretion protein EssC, partial [Ruminococcus sp.]|nr:type VII secretion protein EssC [Ruminococcus sp.]